MLSGLGSAEDTAEVTSNSGTERSHMASLCLRFPISETRIVIILKVFLTLYYSND